MAGCKAEQLGLDRAKSPVELCSTEYKIGSMLRASIDDWVDITDLAEVTGLDREEIDVRLATWECGSWIKVERLYLDDELVSVMPEFVSEKIWPSDDDQLVEVYTAIEQLQAKGQEPTFVAVETRSGWERAEVRRALNQLHASGLVERYMVDSSRAYRVAG